MPTPTPPKSGQRQSGQRSVLITGCSTGIGFCLAKGLSEAGFHIIASCRDPKDETKIKALGVDVINLDLANSLSIRNAVKQTMDLSQGSIYGLINNGAYGQAGAIEDLNRDALRAQFETNVFGTMELTNLVLPKMRAQNEGRIVQISSVLGIVCLPYRGAYNASKYALEALTDTLRLELHDTDIKLSLIEPGPIESAFRKNSLARFYQYIDPEESVHKENYRAMKARLDRNENGRYTLPPEAVLKVVAHALTSEKPKIRYPVTIPTKVMAPLKRLLPDKLMDKFLLASGG